VRGDSANDLIAFVGDPNVSIQESKAFSGNIEPGRRGRGRSLIAGTPEGESGAWRDLPPARHKTPGKHGVVSSRSVSGEET
jgi:formate dehydrogenase major subunit